MSTNDTNQGTQKLVFPELSYRITGICFGVHNALGRFGREKQYCDLLESKLKEAKIPYVREMSGEDANILDFIVDDKIVVEAKAKRLVTKEDFYQTQRYLQSRNKKLGLLINFRNRYLKPIRIIRIDTDARERFI